jgi:hypothetical protein
MFRTSLILLAFAVVVVPMLACRGLAGEGGLQETQPSPNFPTDVTETPLPSPEQTEASSTDLEGPGNTTSAPTPPTVTPTWPEEPPTVDAPRSLGVVPEAIFNSIIDDVVKRTSADPAEIQRLQAEAVVWNDGSLGCPKPGEYYTQAQVEGYWVVLAYRGREFDYRINSQRSFFLCESTLLPGVVPPSGGVPDSPTK